MQALCCTGCCQTPQVEHVSHCKQERCCQKRPHDATTRPASEPAPSMSCCMLCTPSGTPRGSPYAPIGPNMAAATVDGSHLREGICTHGVGSQGRRSARLAPTRGRWLAYIQIKTFPGDEHIWLRNGVVRVECRPASGARSGNVNGRPRASGARRGARENGTRKTGTCLYGWYVFVRNSQKGLSQDLGNTIVGESPPVAPWYKVGA